jgi:hypothetical protein
MGAIVAMDDRVRDGGRLPVASHPGLVPDPAEAARQGSWHERGRLRGRGRGAEVSGRGDRAKTGGRKSRGGAQPHDRRVVVDPSGWQGRAHAEPIVHVEAGAADGSSWEPTPGRPLAGIKVLDSTRVVAGPTGTRFLAACGAEVMRLDSPGSDESSVPGARVPNDLMLGASAGRFWI